MKNDLDGQKSYWWSLLNEFGEETLHKKRLALELTQSEMAKLTGINQSEISRIERGLATPQSVPTFNSISDSYRLSDEDKIRFSELVTGVKKFNNSNMSLGVLKLLKDQIVFVANLNRSGNPKMAIKQAEIIRAWLNNKETGLVISKYKKISKLVSLLLLEESAAWWDIIENRNELVRRTKMLLKQSFLLDSNDSFYLINKVFHYYIFDEYEKAINVFPKIKNVRINDGHNWGIELLRIKIIIAAKTGRLELFNELEKGIYKELASINVDPINKAYLLEGLGKAYSFIDNRKAISVLKESQKLMDGLISSPVFWKIRYVQLVRSLLIATKKFPKERAKIHKNVDLAIQICEQCGFFRHKRQIKELLPAK